MLGAVDAASADFARRLDIVMRQLERNVVDYLNGITTNGQIDAAILVNSQGAMIQALREAGFYELAAEHAARYEAIAADTIKVLRDKGFPPGAFTTVDKTTLTQLASVNIQGLEALGEKAMEELRLALYRNALTSTPFSQIVELVRNALVDDLKRYAYTYANTASLNFSGEVLRIAGERLGAKYYEVVGPDDDATREECHDALGDPVRTKEEWQSAGYWGGTPGGFNCRHQLYPVFR